MTAQAILTTLMIIPVGKLIDVFGAKKMMIIFYALIMVTLVLTIYANFLVFFIVMPLMGIAYSASGAAFQKLTADLTQRNLRGKMVGLFRFFSLIVGAVGSLAGGYVYENTAHVNVFIVAFITFLIGTVLFAYLVKEPKIEEI